MPIYTFTVGSLQETYKAGSPGKAFRRMIRDMRQAEGQDGDPLDYVLIRYRVRHANGAVGRWCYQDPIALSREP